MSSLGGDMTLFLLAGQSNMAGRGIMIEADRMPIGDGIFMLNVSNQWVEAKNPIHFDKRTAGVGPAYSFVKAYAKDHPGEKIGLVPCAVGGTKVCTWIPGGKCYEVAVRRIAAARKDGTFKAILWLQGESDGEKGSGEGLAKKFPPWCRDAWSSLRKECGDANLPLLVGEIGYFNEDCAAKINPLLKAEVARTPKAVLISAAGLTWNSKRDHWHFSRDSQLELGERYYAAFKSMDSLSAVAETYLYEGWEFRREGETTWQSVRVPHDWAIGGEFNRTNDLQRTRIVQDGDADEDAHTGRTGALPWLGKAEYRRKVTIPAGVGYASLVFGGAMSRARVFADGKEIGFWPNGYNTFEVELPTSAGDHEIRVELENLSYSSRWYPGAGIYRPVRLVTGGKVGVRTWGQCICTPDLETVEVKTELRNPDAEKTEVTYRVLDADGKCVAEGNSPLKVKGAHTWSPESPVLYTLETTLACGGRVVEVRRDRFGFRTIRFGNDGFFLNGIRRKFKGVCLHHDLGPIGAAYNDSAFRRQVRILKEMGCDSIRTSHNMPSAEQLKVCDEMGMMVMAESFDEWARAKCRNGYNMFFREWWKRDLANLILAYRNHPSIVMWSIGNEVPDQSTSEGGAICKALQDECHRLDPTRPVTLGIDRPEHSWERGLLGVIDIPGLNYRLHKYDYAYEKVKDTRGFVLGTETASTVSSRGVYKFPDDPVKPGAKFSDLQISSYDTEACQWSNLPDDDWAMQDDRAWTIGEFVWTGFDYLGEPSPYKTEWPSRSSYFGIVDLGGIPKDRFWLYRSRWNESAPTLHVLPHWTWPGREGEVTPVYVYTSYPEAELFVNGVSQGRKRHNPASRLDRYRLRWRETVYAPGELKVIAYDADGKVAAERIVRTAGAPHHIEVSVDRSRLRPASSDQMPDLAFVRVRVVDKDGWLCPNADNRINFAAEGAVSFKAVCNGDPTSLERFVVPTMKAFHGELVAVVESTAVGKGTLNVSSEGLVGAVCELTVGSESKVEIVLPDKPNAIEQYAADELRYHLKKAGAMNTNRRFFIGRVAVERLGLGELASEEHVVCGIGEDILLAGGDREGAAIGTSRGRVACGTLYAVYDFLETEMGVKWIWPGELGEVVPKRAIPAMDGVHRRAREPLELRNFGGEPDAEKMPTSGKMLGWENVENARKDCINRRKFLIRHRIGARRMFNGSHAFTDWWGKYGKEHPEFFNLLPNGKREPLEGDKDGRNVTLCVSQPELWKAIVRRWMKSGYQRPKPGFYVPCVNCCENDTPGMCVCDNCRAWDAPDPRFAENDYWNLSGKCPLKKEGRFRRLADVQWGETGGSKVLMSLPSVSDRYVKFYNSVLAEARKFVPEAEVYGYAYANYLAAPKTTKVSDGVIISFVPRMYFPYTKSESENYRREWMGWRNAGTTQMIYRPNYMLAGANFPYNTARQIADDFAFAATNGMLGVNQDSLTGVWSAQSVQNYVVTRIMREPLAGYEKPLDEFASAFHPAEQEIKDYCAFLERVGEGLTVEDWQELGQRNKGRDGNAGGGFKNYVLVVADVYTEKWFSTAAAMLEKAANRAAGNDEAVARIGFLKKGLEDARLTLLTRIAQKSGDSARFMDALKRLDDYRASVEADGICSYYWTATREMSGAGWFRNYRNKQK